MSEPTESMIEDWNAHNDHADGVEIDHLNEYRGSLLYLFPTLKYFEFEHLPLPLQEVSKPFHTIAWDAASKIDAMAGGDLHQANIGMQYLLQAKDAIVRSFVGSTDEVT